MIKKTANTLQDFMELIVYPTILLLIGFMIGVSDEIILMYGKDSFYLHLLIALVILISSIILKDLPKDSNEN